MQYVISIFLLALLTGCTTQNLKFFESAPKNSLYLNDTPDLSHYKKLEITSKETSKREVIATHFVKEGAYLTASFDKAVDQRLYVQVEECRNSADALCKRRFFLSGDLMAFGSPLRCYIQIRNDLTSGYSGQALQGYCQDNLGDTFSTMLSM